MKAIAGFLFVVILGALAFGLIGWSQVTGAVVGALVWLGLFVWKNLGLGNPVNRMIADLQVQNDYAKQDIYNLKEQRPSGYRAEVKYLENKISERNQDIDSLEQR